MKRKPLDLLESEAFRRWVSYTKNTNFNGISWPEWREAYRQGLII